MKIVSVIGYDCSSTIEQMVESVKEETFTSLSDAIKLLDEEFPKVFKITTIIEEVEP